MTANAVEPEDESTVVSAAAHAVVAVVDPAHSAVTLELAKKESAEHMEGMIEAYEELRNRPLIIKAYAANDPAAPSELSKTVKLVHFVRHGQGFHNLLADLFKAQGKEWKQFTITSDNPYMTPEAMDAPLTEKGRQQAYLLQSRVQQMNEENQQPQLVVLSPNCRALQTGAIVFESLIRQNVPFLAKEEVREETGIHFCDKRRKASIQKMEFPQIDFSLLETDEDGLFQESKRETKMQVAERIYKFMEWLAQRPEQRIGVASHSGWLLTVFNAICESQDDSLKAWWQTGEMRSVKLVFCAKD